MESVSLPIGMGKTLLQWIQNLSSRDRIQVYTITKSICYSDTAQEFSRTAIKLEDMIGAKKLAVLLLMCVRLKMLTRRVEYHNVQSSNVKINENKPHMKYSFTKKRWSFPANMNTLQFQYYRHDINKAVMSTVSNIALAAQ